MVTIITAASGFIFQRDDLAPHPALRSGGRSYQPVLRSSSGSLAMFAAVIRRASSRVSSLSAEHR